MLAADRKTRDFLAEAIRGAADDVVQTHMPRLTQEPAITAKIADRIEQLNGSRLNSYKVSVIAADMPDRGPGSLESKTGVDLLFAIRVQNLIDGYDISKGLLIQAKLDSDKKASERARLVEQCKRMLDRSPKGAFAWIYTSAGILSVPASEVVANPKTDAGSLAFRNISEHMRDVLDCVSGDQNIVRADMFESVVALNAGMKELAMLADMPIQRAIAVSLKSFDG